MLQSFTGRCFLNAHPSAYLDPHRKAIKRIITHSYCPAVPALPLMQISSDQPRKHPGQGRSIQYTSPLLSSRSDPSFDFYFMNLAVQLFLDRRMSEAQQLCQHQIKPTILQEEISIIHGPNIFSTQVCQYLCTSVSRSLPPTDKSCSPPAPAGPDATPAFPERATGSCSAAAAHHTWSVSPLQNIQRPQFLSDNQFTIAHGSG